ncbi:MAG: AMP-binding protein, partial [Alphaproteobacteria bacterium]|nr:AMP-binding protein [Alphaproteobacteria bacterium]
MLAKKFMKQSEFSSYADYMENGAPVVPDNFNFAFDVVDVIAKESPDKLAVLWINDSGDKKSITFRELSEMSNAAANILTERGVKRGDAVLLFLRRRWEYWVLMMTLHKIGAIAIPSTSQLKSHDITYRIDMADVRHIIAFDDGYIMNEISGSAAAASVNIMNPIEIMDAAANAPKNYPRGAENNSDTMMLYFTSGTTDMPKMVAHDFTYPLGHINTAVFWQRLNDNDLHFTLSETGWAKCSWGKMYGQWLAGAAVFVYDFVGKFSAENLNCAISKNRVTSFCAAPTVYKMMLGEDFQQFDLSALNKADIAGEALNPEVYRKFLELTGVKLYEGFGQTETCVMLFTNQWHEPKPGSMGMPAAGWDIQLLGENGKPVENGQI